jgi:hypothetical protein
MCQHTESQTAIGHDLLLHHRPAKRNNDAGLKVHETSQTYEDRGKHFMHHN